MASQEHFIDITPTPRILRILGEIPFQPWQCIAELIDNAIDAFLQSGDETSKDVSKINVTWSSSSVADDDFTLEIVDTASGMSLEQINNAVKAGYSSNDPIHNLGLFGMGFNIATAVLGDHTEILSTRKGDESWTGVSLDFEHLIKNKTFNAPIHQEIKNSEKEHGTHITISKVKSGMREVLLRKEAEIRRQLENIYTPLLSSSNIEIFVKGKRLFPRKHCVWSADRYVFWNNNNVPAIIPIDKDFGSAFFDVVKNRYCTLDESDSFNELLASGQQLPDNIVLRNKHLTGWVGIQRYMDPNDFGIDFVRNGRKILISDKSLFQYENPDTGEKKTEYPVELGSTVGGRIVGELNVDYLLPTYQKNDFDRTDSSWSQTIQYLCGIGPFLPQQRKALGFNDPVSAPIPVLVNAYRRGDAGTKCLAAPNAMAKTFYQSYRAGIAEYLTDDLWWKAAQEEDQRKASGGSSFVGPVNSGSEATDDMSQYITTTPAEKKPSVKPKNVNEDSTPINNSSIEDLLTHSKKVTQLSGNYWYAQSVTPLNVSAYELSAGDILEKGVSIPAIFESDGIECTFIYNPRNETLSQYPISPKTLLLCFLSEKLKARDAKSNLVSVFAGLVKYQMDDTKIDKLSLQEKASTLFDSIRHLLYVSLENNKQEVLECIHESSGEVEETVNNLISNHELLIAFQQKDPAGYRALEYVPNKTLIRLIDKYPQLVFDGKVFNTPYCSISLVDVKATERSRSESKERIMSYLKDALRMMTNAFGSKVQKNELSRAAISIETLREELVES